MTVVSTLPALSSHPKRVSVLGPRLRSAPEEEEAEQGQEDCKERKVVCTA